MERVRVVALQVQKVAANLKLLADIVTRNSKQLIVLMNVYELLQDQGVINRVDLEQKLREKGLNPVGPLQETT